MARIEFTKMHGNGNDFIIVDEYERVAVPDVEKPVFAEQYCDRRFGIGADGVLFLTSSNVADIGMRLIQPDRSEAEMCGNGIRCLVRYALDAGYIKLGTASVETLAGVLEVETRQDEGVWIKVNMGEPLFDRKSIPAQGQGEFIEEDLFGYKVSAVNTGVPHAVVFLSPPELDSLDIRGVAPGIRWHETFPRGTNVNFAALVDGGIRVRTFERGVEDETLSCGTGSVATATVAHRLGFVGADVTVFTTGGPLRISLDGKTAYMDGQAEAVFKGFIDY